VAGVGEIKDRASGLIEHGKTIKQRFDLTHIGRTLQHFFARKGNVLAGGIAYYSLASIAAGMLIAVTVASWLIAGNEQWAAAIFTFVDQAVPGIVGSDGSGLVDPADLRPTAVTGLVGLVAFVVLFNTAARYVGGLRHGIWVMLDASGHSPIVGKLRDFAAVAAIALMVVLGAGLQLVSSVVAQSVADALFDGEGSQVVVRASAAGVLLLVDMTFAGVALVFLGGAREPRRYLLTAVVLTGLALAVLRQAMSLLAVGAASNPVLAPFAAVLTLLIFVDFSARAILYAAAFLGTYRQVRPPEAELGGPTPGVGPE
jgi:membrane protein